MSTIAMNRVKETVKATREIIELFGELRERLGELRSGVSFARRRAAPLSAAAWFSAGIVTGATAAVMFAPKSGVVVRRDLTRAAEKLLEPIARKWREAREEIAARAAAGDGEAGSAGPAERAHPFHS